MDIFAPRHLLIILLIVLVVFGTKKLRSFGPDLGSAIRGFKESLKGGEAEARQDSAGPSVNQLGGSPSDTHSDGNKAQSTQQHKV